MRNLLKFIITAEFLKNLLLAILVLFIIINGTNLFLRLYTSHNRSLAVPNFYGLSIEEAQLLAKKKKLQIEISDSVFQQFARKGTVIDQHPIPGFKVKRYRRIFITMNAFNPEKVAMPYIVGVSLRQAKAVIETQGLRIGKITYVPDIAINNVLQQRYLGKSIEKGSMINKGTAIDLILGDGYSTRNTIPPILLGLTTRNANNLLLQSYLNLGSVIFDRSVKDYKDSVSAIIWKQKPANNKFTFIPLGSSVDVWLTIDSVKLAKVLNDTLAPR